MSIRIIEIAAPDSAFNEIKELCEKHKAVDIWHSAKNKDGRRIVSALIHLTQQQALMDDLQKKMTKKDNWRLTILPAEATIPAPEEKKDKEEEKTLFHRLKLRVSRQITREELYEEVEQGGKDRHSLPAAGLPVYNCGLHWPYP